MVAADQIAQMRSFNRLVTRQVGALNDRYLGHRPLGESRVLFEIGAGGATPRDVRARLGLDSGYLSRMIAALPASRDPLVRDYSERLREILDHHALMLSSSLDLLAVAWRSERLEDELDHIVGLGRPARRLEDLRMDLLVEPRAHVSA